MDFFEGQNPLIFIFLTVILGGGVAFMAGRGQAKGWHSPITLALFMVIFTCALRFLHFALFQAHLLSLTSFLRDGIVSEAFAFFGYRLTLARQMVDKYPWLYTRSGPLNWRSKTDA